jgi:MoaA/NifB/PqqE/SkfB family radical SAM enzyme
VERIIVENVLKTKSGLFVRKDASGLLVYSPYSGLFFACHDNDSKAVFQWLQKKKIKAPSVEYEKALGAGWAIANDDSFYPTPHLLPNAKEWSIVSPPQYPIVINWLLTGLCPLKCRYCYAEDMMRGKSKEPSSIDIEKIAESILAYKPLAVVLTGGDPLYSSNLVKAIQLLHGKTGLIIDSSAFSFNTSILNILKKHDIFVRISLDSESPRVNNELRPLYLSHKSNNKPKCESLAPAVNAICQCVDKGIKVAVQTVATKKNYADFVALGDKLYKLGVNGWRILMIVPSAGSDQRYYTSIDTANSKRLYDYIINNIYTNYASLWKHRMSVQVIPNRVLNSVILVSPDGTFYTESNVRSNGKVIIDNNARKNPSLSQIHKKVNAYAHIERYLNMISE